MNQKFELRTFVDQKNKTFCEYESVEALRSDADDDFNVLKSIDGWYPKFSNTTYNELDNIQTEHEWMVAHITEEGTHELVEFSSTTELKESLPKMIIHARDEEYLTIYRKDKLVSLHGALQN